MFFKILIIYFIFLNCFVLSLVPIKNHNDNTITLIVDPFSNKNQNLYKSGEKCGDSYNRCKSINDAILYFNTIAIATPINNKLSYQQLILQLADGVYSTSDYSFNLFEFNINIEPFNKNSKKVIFNGSNNNNNKNNNSNNALFYVEPVSNTSSLPFKKRIINSNTTSILSSISISDITFTSFSNTIIKIDNRNDENYNTININNCIFNNFTSSPQKFEKYGSPIIYMQSSSSSSSSSSKPSYLVQNQPQKQQLIINNSIFKYSNLTTSLWKTRLIHIENTKSLMNNNIFHNLNGLKSLLNLIYSRFNSDITINSNQFHDIVTFNGLINTDNSMITIINSNFRSIIGNNFGAVLYFQSSSTFPSFTFFIENSNFMNCTSLYSSGVINAFGINNNNNNNNDNDNDRNIINDCTFIENKGPDSSILSCQTIDITIQNSKLQSINSKGGTFLIYTSNVLVENNYIQDEINDDSILDSGRIQTMDKANLKMSSNNFGNDFNHKFKFSCDSSIIDLQNNQNLIPSFNCNQCLHFTINNNNSIC
ncbi:hypothetical protein ACTFIZ_009190 [Dictyostelium cf. discoideum]